MKNQSVLITGGSGFIGGRLAGVLRSDNRVTVLDSLVRGSRARADELEGVEYFYGDVLDGELLAEVMRNHDIVIHAAGIAGIDSVGRSPVNTIRANAMGTESVLRAALECEVAGRVICFSTSEIYGSYAYNVSETSVSSVGSVGEPRWTYAVSKLLAEHLTFSYWSQYQLPTVVVRPFNVYGPGQIGEGAIRKFISRAVKNEDIIVNGSGSQIRAWCFIDDFIEGINLCAESPDAVGESFNIGNSGAAVTTLDLARRIIDLSGSSSMIRYAPALDAEIHIRIPDTTKASQLLGFEPRVQLDEGISKSISAERVDP